MDIKLQGRRERRREGLVHLGFDKRKIDQTSQYKNLKIHTNNSSHASTTITGEEIKQVNYC